MRALVMCRMGPSDSPGIGVVTGQAGPGLFITDVLRSRGVRVPPLSESTVKGLHGLLPPLTLLTNPVDTGRPARRSARCCRRWPLTTRSMPWSSTRSRERRDQPQGRVSHAGRRGCPARRLRHGGPREMLELGRRALDAMGVPQYPTPEQATRAMSALVEDARGRARRDRPSRPQWRPLLRCPTRHSTST